MHRRERSFGALPLVLFVFALLASACGAAPEDNEKPWSRVAFAELMAEAIDEATKGGAGDEQMELLERAQADGAMSLEAARTAAQNVVDCFNEVGGDAKVVEETLDTGLVLPGYLAGFDDDLGTPQIEALIQGCDYAEHYWVNQVYQMQPTSRELVGQYAMSKEPVLRECLERAGMTTDPEATGWDLAHQALELFQSTNFEIDCLGEAGISGL